MFFLVFFSWECQCLSLDLWANHSSNHLWLPCFKGLQRQRLHMLHIIYTHYMYLQYIYMYTYIAKYIFVYDKYVSIWIAIAVSISSWSYSRLTQPTSAPVWFFTPWDSRTGVARQHFDLVQASVIFGAKFETWNPAILGWTIDVSQTGSYRHTVYFPAVCLISF